MLTDDDLRLAKLRLLRMHYESGVGHIGGNLSALDIILLIFQEFLTDSDRFILSKGHAAGALYIALWSVGIINDGELATFHKEATRLPGHPPAKGLAGVQFATGSLGHGLSLAAGTAYALKAKSESGRVFCVTSDGEWQEGATWEALIFLAHHKLDNLTVFVDHNSLQGFGSTLDVASMNPLDEKIRGFGIDVEIIPGHDLSKIREVTTRIGRRPKVVILQTVKGNGVSFMEGVMDWHYRPLTADLYERAVREVAGA